jgi:possible secreted protein
MRLLLAVFLAAVITAAGPAAAADPTSGTDYAALAETAVSLAHDDPASTDWTSAEADNSAATHGKAFPDDRGRTGWFGTAWFDVDDNGCDTRNDILQRDLTDVTFVQGSTCTVAAGTLDDPYTGNPVSFNRGRESSRDVQIDHVIPLGYVYAHGGWAWDADERLQIANDPLNLLAVSGAANAAKSDSGPATSPSGSGARYSVDGGEGWMPVDSDACSYAARFTQVADRYDLGVGDADSQALASVLKDCAEDGDGDSQDDWFAWHPSASDLSGPVEPVTSWIEDWTTRHPFCTVTIVATVCAILVRARRRLR